MWRVVSLRGLIVFVAGAMMLGSASAQFRNQNSTNPFEFALIGDVPYDEEQEAKFSNLINDVNQNPRILWVLHAGDIKGGATLCDDATLQSRFELYQRFNRPFIYTPGDNEWTDCHRDGAGNYHPLERLSLLREIFFPHPRLSSGGEVMPVWTQADDPGFEEFVENVLWVRGRVVFATIHMVGSNNGLSPWSGIDPTDSTANPRPDRIAEVQKRLAAAFAWLAKAFNVADDLQSPGVFIMIQADPRIDSGSSEREAFFDFIEALKAETIAFSGEVVLAHGDTHFFRVDKLLRAPVAGDPNLQRRLENFTRVETFGTSDVHWVRVKVDPLGSRRGSSPHSSGVFSFEPVTVEANRFPR